MGFAAGGAAHHVENRTSRNVVLLEVGDRSRGNEAFYPNDDIEAMLGDDDQCLFTRKNGTPYVSAQRTPSWRSRFAR